MNRAASLVRGGQGWQLILADLALILFLLTLSALPAAEAENAHKLGDHEAYERGAQRQPQPEIAAAQALYRPIADGPGIAAWLADQPRDPRATLTVFVRHRPGGEGAAWDAAEQLADDARASGVAVRTIITGGQAPDLYASLAYDAVKLETAEEKH